MKIAVIAFIGILTVIPALLLGVMGADDDDGQAMPTGSLFRATAALWLAFGMLIEIILIVRWWP